MTHWPCISTEMGSDDESASSLAHPYVQTDTEKPLHSSIFFLHYVIQRFSFKLLLLRHSEPDLHLLLVDFMVSISQ